MWKPVIAAINGIACGGALYLLAESDILIAAEGATFFDPHVTYGMPASYESMLMVGRMPLGELLRMQLTGAAERISAQRAYQVGLVSEVVPLADLHDGGRPTRCDDRGLAAGRGAGHLARRMGGGRSRAPAGARPGVLVHRDGHDRAVTR